MLVKFHSKSEATVTSSIGTFCHYSWSDTYVRLVLSQVAPYKKCLVKFIKNFYFMLFKQLFL